MTPQDIESAVAGMVIRDQKHLAEAISRGVTPGHFADPVLGKLFEAAVACWGARQTPDLPTLSRKVGAEHRERIQTVRSSAPLTANFGPYAGALIDHWRSLEVRQRLGEVSQAMSRRPAMEPLDPLLDRMVDALMATRSGGPALKTQLIADATDESLASLDRRLADRAAGKAVGVTTGLRPLDRVLYGWQPGFVYVLGARTSVGKTTMAANFALAAAKAGHKTAFITVEMSGTDIVDKLLSKVGRVDIGRLLSGSADENEKTRIHDAAAALKRLPILFTEVDKPALDPLAFEVMRLVRIEGVKLVIVDYLQLFELGDERFRPAREEVKTISVRLKSLARTLKVPLLVLSQLNRQAPQDGEPELIHIAETDQIARDADAILFLYRVGKNYFLSVAKHRRGERGVLPLRADLRFSDFGENYEP